MSEENPLLKKIEMPGRKFRLPSRGLFYTNGELDESIKDGEIEVLSMTAIDEISLRSPEFLFSGEAIERVFKRCIPDVKNPLRLLSLDVDYLLTALRIVSYGNVLDLNLRCDKCMEEQTLSNIEKESEFIKEIKSKAKEQKIDFDMAMADQKVISKLDDIRSTKAPRQPYKIDLNGILTNQTTEITDEEFKKYSFTLSNGQKIVTTPLKMDSAVMAFQFQNDDISKDLNKAEDYIAFVMSACILEVIDEKDGEPLVVDNPQFIGEWARKIPIKIKEELSQFMGKQNILGTKFDYKLTCPDCDHVMDGDALLNPITFFIIPSNQADQSS